MDSKQRNGNHGMEVSGRWGSNRIWLLAMGALLLGLACAPRTVLVEGRQVPVEEAAKQAIQEAADLSSAGKLEEAVQKLERARPHFQGSKLAPEAWTLLGDVCFKLQLYERAAEAYRTVVEKHPTSKQYLPAASQLGLSLMKLGRAKEALPTLQTVFDHLPDLPSRVSVAKMLFQSFSQEGASVEAVRWFAVLMGLPGQEQEMEALKPAIEDLIDRQMTFPQVREAMEVLRDKKILGYPLDLLQFKLGKIFYHLLDFAAAREVLEAFVAEHPAHPLLGDAQQLLQKVQNRSKVNPLAIGVLLPLSGEYREYGQRLLEGIQLGFGIFDDKPDKNLPEAPVLVIRDTAGDAEQAVRQVEDLVLNEHVVAIIGPMVAKEAYAAAIKAQEMEVPIITLSSRKDITQVGSFVFRNFLTLEAQARMLVAHAMDKLGVTKFALLYPNDTYGVEFANTFWDEIEKRKGEVRAAERYEPDTKQFAAPIRKMVGRANLERRADYIKEQREIYKKFPDALNRQRAMEKLIKRVPPIVDFEALFIPDYVDKVVLITPALAFEDIVLQTDSNWQIDRMKKSMGREKLDMIYLIGGNGWNSPKLVQWAQKYVQGSLFCDGFFMLSKRQATQTFIERFIGSFDHEPTMMEAQAHDTAKMAKMILGKHHPKDRLSFRSQLLSVKKWNGATGETSFGADREADKRLFLLTVQQDQIIEVDPDAGAKSHDPAG